MLLFGVNSRSGRMLILSIGNADTGDGVNGNCWEIDYDLIGIVAVTDDEGRRIYL